MSGIPGWLLRHVITVEQYEGDGAYGPVYGTAAVVRAFVDEQTRMVRSPAGADVVSSTTAYCRLDTTAPTGSRVALPSGRVTVVINALRRDGGGLATPDHLELQLE